MPLRVGAEVCRSGGDETVVCGPSTVLRRSELFEARSGVDHVVGGDHHRLRSGVHSRIGHEEPQSDEGARDGGAGGVGVGAQVVQLFIAAPLGS